MGPNLISTSKGKNGKRNRFKINCEAPKFYDLDYYTQLNSLIPTCLKIGSISKMISKTKKITSEITSEKTVNIEK